MERQKMEEAKQVVVKRVKIQKVEKIINKRKIRGVMKYLVQQKEFITEYNSWEK